MSLGHDRQKDGKTLYQLDVSLHCLSSIEAVKIAFPPLRYGLTDGHSRYIVE